MAKLVSDDVYSRLVEAVKMHERFDNIEHIVILFQSGHWIEIEAKFYAEVSRDIQPDIARKFLWRDTGCGDSP